MPSNTPSGEAATTATDADWWRSAAVYQIYPRSFADSNADGIGDLRGITNRVPYLASLGIDAVWLSPFYPSALADGGYDIDDYRDVDPRLGTLAEFDEMTAALHAAGLKLIVDIVPNHSSDRHHWFQEALTSPKGSASRERYIFRDGKGADATEPPSDWPSFFGGSAWEPVGDGQFYLHFFAREQPDLNWANPEVRADFLATLRFWADRGVDGFRVDVAQALVKDMTAPLAPWRELEELRKANDGRHPLWDRDEVHEIYADWRRVFDEYEPPRTAIAEAWVAPERRARYASPDGLGQAFNFDLLGADFDATKFRSIISFNLDQAELSGSSSTWVLSNHDVVRHATRYGLPAVGETDSVALAEAGREWLLSGGEKPFLDKEAGLDRARAATLLIMALPGSVYLYQGEELGLHEVADIPDDRRQDPAFFRNREFDRGRDGCRVPLPWASSGPSLGFGEGETHLPQPAWFADSSVDRQAPDEASTLSLYRRALAIRREASTEGGFSWEEHSDDQVLHFRRAGGMQCVSNFSGRPVPLPQGEILVSSAPLDGRSLPANATVWMS